MKNMHVLMFSTDFVSHRISEKSTPKSMLQHFTVSRHLDIESNIRFGLCSRQFLRYCKQSNGKTFVYKSLPYDRQHVRKIELTASKKIDYSSRDFDHVTHFRLQHSEDQVIKFPQVIEFPKHLEHLELKTRCIRGVLPKTLLSLNLYIDEESLLEGLDNHPNLTKLHIHGKFKMDIILPPNLTDLKLASYVKVVGPFPKNLTILKLNRHYRYALPTLPEYLVSLDLGFLWVHPLPILPNTLEHLVLPNMASHPIPCLPSHLRSLEFSGISEHPLPHFPESLETLSLPYEFQEVITYLPPNLKVLELFSNNIISKQAAFSSVTSLILLHQTTIVDFPSIFPNVEKIDIIDCHIDALPCFPRVKTLTLKMVNCPKNWDGWNSLQSLKVFSCEGLLTIPKTVNRVHLQSRFLAKWIHFDLPDGTTVLELSGYDDKSIFVVRISPHSRLRHFKISTNLIVKVVPHFPKSLRFINETTVVHKELPDGVEELQTFDFIDR